MVCTGLLAFLFLFLKKQIEASYELDKSKGVASKLIERSENLNILEDFFSANGPEKIVVYQNQEVSKKERKQNNQRTNIIEELGLSLPTC